jgi:chromosome segregation and condensation protein ScpB
MIHASMNDELNDIKQVLEAALLVAGEPVQAAQLA